MSEFTVRPVAGEADFAFGVELFDACLGKPFGINFQIDQIRIQWAQSEDPVRRVYIVEIDGQPVAAIGYHQISSNDERRRFFLYMFIMPENHSATLLDELFRYLYELVAEHNPDELKMSLDEFLEDHIVLAEAQGFVRTQRDQFSSLNLKRLDLNQFADVLAHVKASGIRLLSLPEYEQENPEYKAAIADLTNMINQDVPGSGSVITTVELLEERVFQNPAILQDAFILALDGDQLVGMSYVTRLGDEKACITQLTGVIRSHRRRGITTAMKVTAFKIVQDMGFERILTNNEENNPMYQINLKFGFEPESALFHYTKTLTTS